MKDVEEHLLPWNDGSPRYVRHWRRSGARAVVLCVHGSESHGGWFDEVARALVADDLAVFAYDRSGWGESPGRRGTLRSTDDVLAELEGAVDHLRASYDKIHLVGLSWGGLLAAVAREKFPGAFASVTLIVPAIFPRRRPTALAIARGIFTGAEVPLGIEPEEFTGDPVQAKQIRDDEKRITAVNVAFLRVSVNLAWAAQRSFHRSPSPATQILLAANDRLIDTERTAALASQRKVPHHRMPNTVHSLVLERPKEVADKVAQLAKASDKEAIHAS